jgi:hypothetical protein
MRISILAILIIIAFSSCSTKKKNPAVDMEKLKEELVALQYEEDKAESDRDFATLDKILSEDLTIDFLAGITDLHIPNRDSFYMILRKSPPDSTYIKPLYENNKMTTAGDTVVMDYKVTFYEDTRDGDTLTSYFQNTVKWIKVDGRWKMITVKAILLPEKNE